MSSNCPRLIQSAWHVALRAILVLIGTTSAIHAAPFTVVPCASTCAHEHCKCVGWTTESTVQLPWVESTQPPDVFTANPGIPVHPEPPGVVGNLWVELAPRPQDFVPPISECCSYEISDLTKVTLTFTSTAPPTPDPEAPDVPGTSLEFGVVTLGPWTLTPPPNTSWVIQSGTPWTLTLPPHCDEQALLANLNGSLNGPVLLAVPLFMQTISQPSVTLEQVQADFSVVNITLTGHHYYVVPEPASPILLGMAVLGAMARHWRRKDRPSDRPA